MLCTPIGTPIGIFENVGNPRLCVPRDNSRLRDENKSDDICSKSYSEGNIPYKILSIITSYESESWIQEIIRSNIN